MPFKKMWPLAWCIACFALLTGCSGFGEEAPLSDGLYLNYDYGGSNLQVTFYEIDTDSFYAALSFGSEAENNPEDIPDQNKTIVDRRLKKESGGV